MKFPLVLCIAFVGLSTLVAQEPVKEKRHEIGVGLECNVQVDSVIYEDFIPWYMAFQPFGRDTYDIAYWGIYPEISYTFRLTNHWSIGARLSLGVASAVADLFSITPQVRPNIIVQYRVSPDIELGMEFLTQFGLSVELFDHWYIYVAPGFPSIWNYKTLDFSVAAMYMFRL